MSRKGKVILIGDSILDNFYWLPDKRRDLSKELSDLNFIVNNYAVNESMLQDVIQGIAPRDVDKDTRPYPYLIDNDGKVYPLKLLATTNQSFNSVYKEIGINSLGFGTDSFLSDTSSEKENKFDEIVILSVGGNDMRSKKGNIIFGLDYYFSSVVTEEFISQYERIIEEIQQRCPKIILISMYLPYLGPGSAYGIFSIFAQPMITRWRGFLSDIARKYDIPLLDLSRTVNCYTREHYGTTEIEPSHVSNKCLAECISYIYDNYDGYRIYFAPDCDISKIKTA